MRVIKRFPDKVFAGLVSLALMLASGMCLVSGTAFAAGGALLPLGGVSLPPLGTITLDSPETSTSLDLLDSHLTNGRITVTTPLGAASISATGDTQRCRSCRPSSSIASVPPSASRGMGQGAETTRTNDDQLQKLSSEAPLNLMAADKLVTYTTAVIHVTTAQPAKVYVRFGLNGNLATATPTSEYGTTHDLKLDAGSLVPGSTYSYEVVSEAQDGTKTTSLAQTFTTKGLTVYITVLDKNHQPLRNKSVSLHSVPMTAITDDNGVAKFTNVAPGRHTLLYKTAGQNHSQTVTVTNNVTTKDGRQIADAQHVSVMYDFAQPVSRERATWSLVAVGIVALLGVMYWLWRFSRMRRRSHNAAALRAKIPVYASEPEEANDEASR